MLQFKGFIRAARASAMAAAAALAIAWGPGPAAAQDAFYEGETVELIVPHGAGGGFDTYARASAPYLEEYLGATVVVKNVTGAGGNIGRNQLYRAEPDGLTIGFSSFPSMIFSQLSGADGIQYDVNEWEILGRVVAESEVISVPAAAKYQSLEELRNADGPVRIPLSGVGDDTFFKAMIVARGLGIDVVPVTGYDGASEAFAAGMRGDGEILSSSIGSSLQLIEAGEITPILQISLVPATTLEGVPLASEVIEDEVMASFVKSIAGISALDRSFFAPPGVPEERLETLRAAVAATMENPDFLAEMEQLGRAIDFMPADEATAVLEEAMANSDALVPLLEEALQAAQ
jgi:tripartite-type tricarboxylate transporter receptor subunit TctC